MFKTLLKGSTASKKLLTLIAIMGLGSMQVMADTTIVGNEDNSSNGWTAFSDYYPIAPNKTLTLKFTNYSAKTENWHNWLLAITTDADRWNNEQGYFEYAVLRPDNWAYQPGIYENEGKKYEKNTGAEKEPEGETLGITHNWYNSIRSNYDWDTFRNDMDGSTVEVTIERMNAYVKIYAKITTTNAKEYFEEFIIRCDDGKQNMRAFLTVEKAHIVIDNDATAFADTYVPDGLVGEINNTTKGWTDFSDYYKMSTNQALTLEFENYSNKEANWNNWLLGVTTNTDRWDWDGGYEEYLTLRNDNWNVKAGSNEGITSNFNWDTFKDDMDGSTVKLTVTRDGAKITAHADVTTVGGTEYFEQLVVDNCGDGEQAIRAFLTVDHSCIDLTKHEITNNPNPSTGISTVKATDNTATVRYNLAGQRVGADFKGVVIENGRKVMVK